MFRTVNLNEIYVPDLKYDSIYLVIYLILQLIEFRRLIRVVWREMG